MAGAFGGNDDDDDDLIEEDPQDEFTYSDASLGPDYDTPGDLESPEYEDDNEEDVEEKEDDEENKDEEEKALDAIENFDMDKFENANAIRKVKMVQDLKKSVDEAGDGSTAKGVARLLKYATEEQALEVQLPALNIRLQASGKTFLGFMDGNIYRKAKKHKRLKKQVNQIKQTLKANRQKMWQKIMQTIGPIIPYILIGLAIVLGALIITASVIIVLGKLGIMPYRQWIQDLGVDVGESSGQGADAQFGVKGDKFYGMRAIYKDDEKSRNELVVEYVDLLVDSIAQIEQSTTFTVDEKNYIVETTINIDIPENYDYLSNVDDFKTNYLNLYNYTNSVAEIVFKVDNPSLEVPEDLVEKLNGIKYFGLSENIIGDLGTSNTIINIVSNLLINNYSYTALLDNSVVADEEKPAELTAKVEEFINGKVVETINVDENKIRAEKLFIRDFILESNDSMVSGVSKQNYVAFIFMPKQNVTFNKFSFMFVDVDETFEERLMYNDADLGLSLDSKFDKGSWKVDGVEMEDDEGSEVLIYYTKEMSLNVPTYQNIDTNNLNMLKSGMSLYSLVKTAEENSVDITLYLTISTDENSIQFLTYKSDGVILTMQNPVPFGAVEFETIYN